MALKSVVICAFIENSIIMHRTLKDVPTKSISVESDSEQSRPRTYFDISIPMWLTLEFVEPDRDGGCYRCPSTFQYEYEYDEY